MAVLKSKIVASDFDCTAIECEDDGNGMENGQEAMTIGVKRDDIKGNGTRGH